MYKVILALAILTTIGAVQLPLAFAAAPPQGGDPHDFTFRGDQLTPSTGDPHSAFAPTGNPHLCIDTSGKGAKVGQC